MEQDQGLMVGPSAPAPRAMRKDVMSHADSWSGVLSGLGGARDKTTDFAFTADTLLDKTALVALWTGDGIARRIVNSIPEDEFRQWGVIQNDPTDLFDEGLCQSICTALGARGVMEHARICADLQGGSLVFVGVTGGGAFSSPLDPKRIKTFDYLKVYDLGSILTKDSKFDTNPNSPTFGQILQYKVKVKIGADTKELMLDASRCVPFFGEPLPLSASGIGGDETELRYWGTSVLTYCYGDLKQFRSAFAAVYNILQEMVIGKYKISDLDAILNDPNGKTLLKNRLEAMEKSKSAINAVILGDDEEYTRDSINLSAVPEILDRAMMLLAGVAGQPVTKLFGRSAAGLNATGDGDQANYYDRVRARQNRDSSSMQKFANLLAGFAGIGEVDHTWTWNPLKQQTVAEANEAVRIRAEAYRTFMVGAQLAISEGIADEAGVNAVVAFVFPEFATAVGTPAEPDEPVVATKSTVKKAAAQKAK